MRHREGGGKGEIQGARRRHREQWGEEDPRWRRQKFSTHPTEAFRSFDDVRQYFSGPSTESDTISLGENFRDSLEHSMNPELQKVR